MNFPFLPRNVGLNLQHNSYLRELIVDLQRYILPDQENLLSWFRTTCETILSSPLVVVIEGIESESDYQQEAEGILIDLADRVDTLTVKVTKWQDSLPFPRLQQKCSVQWDDWVPASLGAPRYSWPIG